jgi:hypothetical protein
MEEVAKAGVLLTGDGLMPSASGSKTARSR